MLEERTEAFAGSVRTFLKMIPKTVEQEDDMAQLRRAAGSVAANYIEANEALGKPDFCMRIRICLKESKEARLWLRLLDGCRPGTPQEELRQSLINESHELVRIFGAILRTVKKTLHTQ
ncbi:hypothetical protein A3C37_03275 [Candidatus Peribacteria bacterium RIFCSPHIGHO2_02_FULL_53_20]|nr:MAG: hypothetical protein A3C37_03275 [Candidatus Peribacteria bacterium RIFCSPHIGHO2_02_FULL_53_20]OGJ67407.1 MAG: hypothetical protein A3B61_00555 [Candidatus Peribacteria bacterium RIFCSPLOWO2_01_FULL_53_10]OGJ72615.1 MAG: hypothetical protein A3G69_01710 [Candidatus Peribacteria bacterium RIFCSPLOWO2_12_FULL_53_10]